MVIQREVGSDTLSFADALRRALRQDPDIILIGEMRDYETMSVASSAAETGHLVLATLNTSSAKDSITRIIDVFPSAAKAQVRTNFAASLQGIVAQTLCRTTYGEGRVAAVEIPVGTLVVRALIRGDKLRSCRA